MSCNTGRNCDTCENIKDIKGNQAWNQGTDLETVGLLDGILESPIYWRCHPPLTSAPDTQKAPIKECAGHLWTSAGWEIHRPSYISFQDDVSEERPTALRSGHVYMVDWGFLFRKQFYETWKLNILDLLSLFFLLQTYKSRKMAMKEKKWILTWLYYNYKSLKGSCGIQKFTLETDTRKEGLPAQGFYLSS